MNDPNEATRFVGGSDIRIAKEYSLDVRKINHAKARAGWE